MKVFDKVRVALWDPTEKGVKARAEVSTGLAWAKPGCAVGIAFGVAGVALGTSD